MSAMKWISKGLKNLGMGGASNSVTVPPALQSRLAGTQAAITIPPKPKRPLSAYFRYLGEVRPEIVKKNPNIKTTEVTKLVAERWSKMDTVAKEKYSLTFKDEMKTYHTVIEKYLKSLSPAQIEAQEQGKINKELRQERIEKKRRLTELGKPKKPPSAFLQFLQRKVPAGSTMKEHTETAQKYGPIWKNLTEAEKGPWNTKYEKDFAAYQVTLKKWESDMLKLGHDDLVRTRQPKGKEAGQAKTNPTKK